VNDDFGDVFGFFFAISGESFTNPELVRYAEQLGANWCWFPALAKSLSAVRSHNKSISISRWQNGRPRYHAQPAGGNPQSLERSV
jgi:hypothetical protein